MTNTASLPDNFYARGGSSVEFRLRLDPSELPGFFSVVRILLAEDVDIDVSITNGSLGYVDVAVRFDAATGTLAVVLLDGLAKRINES